MSQQVRQQQPQSPRCTVHAYVLAGDHANGQAKRPARGKFPPLCMHACACSSPAGARGSGPRPSPALHNCVRSSGRGALLVEVALAWSVVSSQPAWSAREPSRAPASIPACNSNCRFASVLQPHAHTHARMRSHACAHTRTRALAHTLHPSPARRAGAPINTHSWLSLLYRTSSPLLYLGTGMGDPPMMTGCSGCCCCG